MDAEQKDTLDRIAHSLERVNFYARLMSYGMILMIIVVVFIAFFSKICIY